MVRHGAQVWRTNVRASADRAFAACCCHVSHTRHPMSFAAIDGRCIEYAAIPGDSAAPGTLVFLHEGLGSIALWRDFPRKVASRLRAPALVYSRFGYGASDGLQDKRTPRFMHDEALTVLPALLDRLG